MLQNLVAVFSVLLSTTLAGWLFSSAMAAGRSMPDGATQLGFTPAMHVYGTLMGIGVLASSIGFGSIAFVDPASGASAAFLSVCVLAVSGWGLYAGYGGRLSYSADGIFYHGIKAKRFAKWEEVSAVRDGEFAQFVLIENKPYVLSKGLRGYQDFVYEARRRGVAVDQSLSVHPH